ncbi:MAG: large conductance mechanosensitive channel protein MscL [Clostridia bacterium]|nr:large conductance mechanosensitive channel protein MscL [Clostridia bacterium]
MLKEFKEFIARGNVMDLAIGIIIGGAFQKIVNSLVNDIIMPFTSIFTGKLDYTSWVINIGNTTLGIGNFITAILNFLIMAFSIFLMVRYFNKINKKIENMTAKEMKKLNKKFEKRMQKFKKKGKEIPQDPKPTTKVCKYCFTEININATRCPHCTSVLEEKESEVIDEQISIN